MEALEIWREEGVKIKEYNEECELTGKKVYYDKVYFDMVCELYSLNSNLLIALYFVYSYLYHLVINY